MSATQPINPGPSSVQAKTNNVSNTATQETTAQPTHLNNIEQAQQSVAQPNQNSYFNNEASPQTETAQPSAEQTIASRINNLKQIQLPYKKILLAIAGLGLIAFIAFQLLVPKNPFKNVFWNSDKYKVSVDDKGIAHVVDPNSDGFGELTVALTPTKDNLYKLDLNTLSSTSTTSVTSSTENTTSSSMYNDLIATKLIEIKDDKVVLVANWENNLTTLLANYNTNNNSESTDMDMINNIFKELIKYIVEHSTISQGRIHTTFNKEGFDIAAKFERYKDDNSQPISDLLSYLESVELDANTLELRRVSALGRVEKRIPAYR